MMNRFLKKSLLVLCFFFSSAACWPADPMPEKPMGFVNDFANVLDVKTRADLQALIEQVEKKTTCEIAVVTVPSLQGLTVEDYASELFKKWGIGKKGKDNGVLLLVAPNDRKVRIEVGYGAESVLTDGKCGQIIRDECLPKFKDKDYNGGVWAATAQIASVLTGDTPQRTPGLTKEDLDKGFEYFKYIFFSFVFLFAANGLEDAKTSRRSGGRFWKWIVSFCTIVSWIIA